MFPDIKGFWLNLNVMYILLFGRNIVSMDTVAKVLALVLYCCSFANIYMKIADEQRKN